ncbi:MAG: site-2 protease family protein [Deltaproteobacteria bacterium]|nr:site-2 protease family protein [Deltaproteobacteria bacterium]
MNNDALLWRFCVHEAGHAICAIALGHRVNVIFARPDGGYCEDTATPATDCALITAAGPAAEQLLSSEPPPAAEAPTQPATPPQRFAHLATSEVIADLSHRVGCEGQAPLLSDDVALAQYAIRGAESDPQRWIERLTFVKAYAARIVEQQRDKILILARELYLRGFLSANEIQLVNEESKNERVRLDRT